MNNDNNVAPPAMPAQRKEPHENIARIAKRYLDDNMQQAWINPRLISMINMDAVTSTDYDSSNLSRNFNQVGFNTYNYSQFEEKYKPWQSIKYGDEYLEYGRNAVRNPMNPKSSTRHPQDPGVDKNARSHSQPERQHNSSYEARSKSQDSREQLTFYQIDPPLKHESRHTKCHRSLIDKSLLKGKELTFYEIDGPPGMTDKSKEAKTSGPEKMEKKEKAGITGHSKYNHTKQSHQDQKINGTCGHQLNRSQSDLTDNQSTNLHRSQCHSLVEPPKYRQFDRPPRYQEDPPKAEPPPKYHQDPPKYSEVTNRRQEDVKRNQEEKGRRQAAGSRGGGGVCGGAHGIEAPANLASITPTAREATRGGVTTRQRQTHKQTTNDVRIKPDDFIDDDVETLKYSENSSKSSAHYQCHQVTGNRCGIGTNGVVNNYGNAGVILGVTLGGVIFPEVSTGCNADSKFKGTIDSFLRTSEVTQGRLNEKSMIKIDKPKNGGALHEVVAAGSKFAEKMKSVQEAIVYKHHEPTAKTNNKILIHEPTISHVGYKVENLKYYGELKGYDFKSYGTIDKPPIPTAHEKSHQYASSDKGSHQNNHEKSHARSLQGYGAQKVSQSSDKSVYSEKYGDHYYHRSSHVKPANAFQVYQETKYSYNVNGVPGTPAQASAAAAFFARMTDLSSYAVVKFDQPDSNGKFIVELVPNSWILEDDGLVQCHWPPPHLEKYIQKWIEQSKSPSITWSKYVVEILTTAANYEKGLRRLKRSYKRASSLESSEDENTSKEPTVLSKSAASRLLSHRKPLSNLSTVIETMEENEISISAITGSSTESKKKSSQPCEERMKVLRSQIDNDELKAFIADYIDMKHDILLSSITGSITSAKRSILYDLDKKLDAVKLSVCMETNAAAGNRPSPTETFEVSLPIKDIDDFLKFDDTLNRDKQENKENPEKLFDKQRALKHLYGIVTSGSDDYEADIKTIIPKMITKAVQLKYSGAGRVIHGIGKRNFSETMTYKYMKEFLETKYEKSSKKMAILSVTSRYLSGAGDREGGYAIRKNKSANMDS